MSADPDRYDYEDPSRESYEDRYGDNASGDSRQDSEEAEGAVGGVVREALDRTGDIVGRVKDKIRGRLEEREERRSGGRRGPRGSRPPRNDSDTKQMFRNAEQSASMTAPLDARIDPAGDLGRGLWDFAAGTGGRQEGPGEMAMGNIGMESWIYGEARDNDGFSLVFGEREREMEEDDGLYVDPFDIDTGGLI